MHEIELESNVYVDCLTSTRTSCMPAPHAATSKWDSHSKLAVTVATSATSKTQDERMMSATCSSTVLGGWVVSGAMTSAKGTCGVDSGISPNTETPDADDDATADDDDDDGRGGGSGMERSVAPSSPALSPGEVRCPNTTSQVFKR